MTSVVGILNKQGVAIASDSAVTRTRGNDQKITKNGNKMIRLCESVPISVMITGNADFLQTPWETIVRYYRKYRGHTDHATVEDAVHDFFTYVAKTDLFWEPAAEQDWFFQIANNLYCEVKPLDGYFIEEDSDDPACLDSEEVANGIINCLKCIYKGLRSKKKSCQFESFSIKRFRTICKDYLDTYFCNNTELTDDTMQLIRPDFEKTLLAEFGTILENDIATLVFSGYGKNEDFPSLVAVTVSEGLDHRVNYHIEESDIISISDGRPVAVCPFAQKDIIKSLLRGVHTSWSEDALDRLDKTLHRILYNLDDPSDEVLFKKLFNIPSQDLIDKFIDEGMDLLNGNQRDWETRLADYDLESLASLAESLIELTGFHRILTFAQEGVGGPVDLAVISKNDGFIWLKRKSWYHHKDVNGQYGSLGI